MEIFINNKMNFQMKQIEDLRAQKHIDINENEIEDGNKSKDLIDLDSNS